MFVPLALMTCPDTHLLPAWKAITSAAYSGVPSLSKDLCACNMSTTCSGFSSNNRPVVVGPGATAFTVMFFLSSSFNSNRGTYSPAPDAVLSPIE